MSEVPILLSPRLSGLAGVRHAFFTRQGGVSESLFDSLNVGLGSADDPLCVAENRQRAANALGGDAASLATCYQIHAAMTVTIDAPGEADLTVHADFPAVLASARAAGANSALLTQAEFLRRLGVEARAAALAKARPDRADIIARQLKRLTAPDQMGELFKVAAIWAGPPPPAFEDAA